MDANGDTYMINEKFNLSSKEISTFKSELKKKFEGFATKELQYLFTTKIGVSDTTEKSTTSVVESFKQETQMKKLTIKELFSEEEKKHSDKVKDSNAVDLDKTTPPIEKSGDKKLYFDEEKDAEDKLKKEITTAGPATSGSEGGFKDGASSGAGGYNTKYAWKNTPYGKNKTQKRPTVTKDWKVVPESDKNEVEVTEKPNSKGSGVVEPKEKKNSDPKTGNGSWKDTNQSSAPKSDNDGFWTEVDLEPGTGYIPKGMKQNYVMGMHNASAGDMKKKGYAEGKSNSGEILNEGTKPKKEIDNSASTDLTRKKFFSLSENEEKGVNKRYLITEKTTEEYEKERWKKLSSFKLYESIKEAEEMNEFFESIQNDIEPIVNPITIKRLTENVSHDDIFAEPVKPGILNESTEMIDGEEIVTVAKPGSKFGLEYKFFKKDFLNESKHYILDLNSNERTYVKNPNWKK